MARSTAPSGLCLEGGRAAGFSWGHKRGVYCLARGGLDGTLGIGCEILRYVI